MPIIALKDLTHTSHSFLCPNCESHNKMLDMGEQCSCESCGARIERVMQDIHWYWSPPLAGTERDYPKGGPIRKPKITPLVEFRRDEHDSIKLKRYSDATVDNSLLITVDNGNSFIFDNAAELFVFANLLQRAARKAFEDSRDV